MLSEITGCVKSKNIRAFFINPENSFIFILLVPMIRKLPFPDRRGKLGEEETSIQNGIFSPEALMKIQQSCESKDSSKPGITIKKLMKDMKEELSKQAKVSDKIERRTKQEVSIDDAITTMIKIIEIIFIEKLQEKSISSV